MNGGNKGVIGGEVGCDYWRWIECLRELYGMGDWWRGEFGQDVTRREGEVIGIWNSDDAQLSYIDY